MSEPKMKDSKLWTTYTFAKEASEVGWAGVGTPKALCYESPEVGAVALIEWPDGRVSILRREKDNTTSVLGISAECLDKIAELRGPLPGAMLAT